MLHKLKLILISASAVITFTASTMGLAVYLSPTVSAQPVMASFTNQACTGLNQVGGSGCGHGSSTISHLMTVVLNILSIVAGFIAVVMVIVSGIKFMTAAGDASQISSARQSLIYALVGIIVVAFSQFIVHFVIGKVT